MPEARPPSSQPSLRLEGRCPAGLSRAQDVTEPSARRAAIHRTHAGISYGLMKLGNCLSHGAARRVPEGMKSALAPLASVEAYRVTEISRQRDPDDQRAGTRGRAQLAAALTAAYHAVMKLRATVRSVSASRQSPRNGTTCSRSVSA